MVKASAAVVSDSVLEAEWRNSPATASLAGASASAAAASSGSVSDSGTAAEIGVAAEICWSVVVPGSSWRTVPDRSTAEVEAALAVAVRDWIG